MIDFTKEMVTAINILAVLTDKPISTADIAERLGVSQSNIFNVTPKLARAGLIVTFRGRVGGGIVAGKENPNLYDLFTALYRQNSDNLEGHIAELHYQMLEALKTVPVTVHYSEHHSKKSNEILDSETRAAVERGLKDAAEGRITLLDLEKELQEKPKAAVDEVIEEVQGDGDFTW